MTAKHTPEPWALSDRQDGNWWHIRAGNQAIAAVHAASKKRNEPYASMFEANARRIVACVNACAGVETETLIQVASKGLFSVALDAVHEKAALMSVVEAAKRAIGDHNAPHDCYTTGPFTGDAYLDLVQCPACDFTAKYDALCEPQEVIAAGQQELDALVQVFIDHYEHPKGAEGYIRIAQAILAAGFTQKI